LDEGFGQPPMAGFFASKSNTWARMNKAQAAPR